MMTKEDKNLFHLFKKIERAETETWSALSEAKTNCQQFVKTGAGLVRSRKRTCSEPGLT